MKHFGRPCSVLKRALEIKLNLKKLNLNSYNNLGHKRDLSSDSEKHQKKDAPGS